MTVCASNTQREKTTMLKLQAQWRPGEPQSRESSMILVRRTLKQCRSYKSSHCKLLLVMTQSYSPPVCGLNYCSAATLCIFCIWKNVTTQPLYRRGVGFLEAYWMQLCSHFKDTNLSSLLTLMNCSFSPSRAEFDCTYFPQNTPR